MKKIAVHGRRIHKLLGLKLGCFIDMDILIVGLAVRAIVEIGIGGVKMGFRLERGLIGGETHIKGYKCNKNKFIHF